MWGLWVRVEGLGWGGVQSWGQGRGVRVKGVGVRELEADTQSPVAAYSRVQGFGMRCWGFGVRNGHMFLLFCWFRFWVSGSGWGLAVWHVM